MKLSPLCIALLLLVILFAPSRAEESKKEDTKPPQLQTEEAVEPEPPLLNLSTPAERTYLFSNHYWWESPDHQVTTIVTLLAIAHNLSATTILPTIPKPSHVSPSNKSLLGDYFTKHQVHRVQPVLTLPEFLNTSDYRALRDVPTSQIPFPKDSQEEYEAKLHIYGTIEHTTIKLPMPHVDPEHTNQYCDHFPATMFTSAQGIRYIFLDRIHFMHFCAEKFLPWWYDVRHRIAPRQPYYHIAGRFQAALKKPVAVVHVSDLMESERERETEEIERYAREIVDALRKKDALGGSMYFIYHPLGRNVAKVVDLLKEEFKDVHTCQGMYECMGRAPRLVFDPPLDDEDARDLFRPDVALRMVEWALGASTDVFIGNIHSPYSRNICLHRKMHGKPYSVLRGFGELRKIWQWNL